MPIPQRHSLLCSSRARCSLPAAISSSNKAAVLLHLHMMPCRLQISCITCKQVVAGRSQKRLSSMGGGGEKKAGANARVDSWRAPKDRDKQRSAPQAERVVSAARYQGPDLELAAQLER